MPDVVEPKLLDPSLLTGSHRVGPKSSILPFNMSYPMNVVSRILTLLLPSFVPSAALHAQLNYAAPYTFTTLAGNSAQGSADGTGNGARFNNPNGAAVDSAGNIYIADSMDHTVRKITATGVVTTFAGLAGRSGSSDGTGSGARFKTPACVTVDGAGTVYVADSGNHTIRKITNSGVVTTLAGIAGFSGSIDGTGTVARFYNPSGLAVDIAGDIYVGDTSNGTIRKISTAGVVTTLAGAAGLFGSTDGTGSTARFSSPKGVAVDEVGSVYVADWGNSTIRKVTSDGTVTTLAGAAGSGGSNDGTGSGARFYVPEGVAVDSTGNIYVADTGNSTIRKITITVVVTTLAGTAGSTGLIDSAGSAARFYRPRGVAVDSTGNVYAADTGNYNVRKITAIGVVTTIAGTVGSLGSADGVGAAARFRTPTGVAVDGAGAVYVADSGNHTIRKITPNGVVTTFAGIAGMSGSTDGIGTVARFRFPEDVAVDFAGNIYVADTGNRTIRKITASGVVSTLAGRAGFGGTADGTGTAARFASPTGLAVESAGNIYVADKNNNSIRRVTANGEVMTLVVTVGAYGSTHFSNPSDVAIDSAGNVYVADQFDRTIQRIGESTTVFAGFSGIDGSTDGAGTDSRFLFPYAVTVDNADNVYVADFGSGLIRKISPSRIVTTLAGNALQGGSSDGTGSVATFRNPQGIAVDYEGNIYVADTENNTIRKGALADIVAPSNAIITITVE